jgi:cytochrome c oxidase subunit 3
MSDTTHYYVPNQSHWPITGSLGLGATVIGIANMLHGNSIGHLFFFVGALTMAYMMFGWFRDVIRESMQGMNSQQMDRSYRWGMAWFIFSEVMFFAAFFGALFYARQLSIPWLSGAEGIADTHVSTHKYLWPNFTSEWPVIVNPDPEKFPGPEQHMGWKGIPLINTLLLLTSGVTITWAHHALRKCSRVQLAIGLFLTIALGATFLGYQAYEYYEAYHHMKLTLASGIYGSTFFMLTGFHGAHVTIGTIMLIIMFLRCLKGHFTPEHHFAFEAVAWYWHFVDFVWLGLFIFVYVWI